MPTAFSFSAPLITIEQEIAEREALSQTELQTLWCETHGHQQQHHHLNHDEDVVAELMGQHPTDRTPLLDDNLQIGLNLMSSAMEELPLTERQSFLDACEQCPDLVRLESPAHEFYIAEGYNPWAAAVRRALYWHVRKAVFGAERAFLPMTLAGAMADDAQYLQEAYALPAPNDKHGRPVLFLNRSRVGSSVPLTQAQRCSFYVVHAMLQQRPECCHTGYVILASFKDFDLYKNYSRQGAKMAKTAAHCFPAKMMALHVYTGTTRLVRDVVLPVLKHCWGKEVRLRLILHAGCDRAVLSDFGEYGLSEEHVRLIFGGLLSNRTKATAFVDHRLAVESAN